VRATAISFLELKLREPPLKRGRFNMTTTELRQKYLEFFKSKGHAIIPSASLLPENDPTTLFTSSGMQPLIPYLLGEKHPHGRRLCDSQKSFRTQDIDEVGDNRHTTFFEMLGNWSLGDYFKKEQIPWIYEFVTKTIGLDPRRLYVTCFRGFGNIPKDENAASLWVKEFTRDGVEAKVVDFSEKQGMSGGRIFYYDETKNWWSRSGVPSAMPVGEPGGPDAEMFWDFGEKLGWHEKSEWKDAPCHVNCDCGRFLEIGNSVFMEYQKIADGFAPLSQKNVDFGGGLERLAAAAQDTPDIFCIDLFKEAIKTLERISTKKYFGEEFENPGVVKYLKNKISGDDFEDVRHSFRVILDHVRAAVFLISDGALPNNKDQGYFTRRLIRRSVWHGHKLQIFGQLVCPEIAQTFIEVYKDNYPELENKKKSIIESIREEEEKFYKTLKNGSTKFHELVKAAKIGHKQQIDTKEAFDLYQSYGFPVELTQELAAEEGLAVATAGFQEEFEKHQKVSRAGAEQKFKGGLADASVETARLHTATHLLHAALRKVLGTHVEQKGSNITVERLRFDFSHPEKMTEEQKKQVEDLVNEAIAKDLPVTIEEMSVDEAKAKGAIGLFGDKYGERVKVYTVGDPASPFSGEICGGPHVEHTGELGHFEIKKEEAISAGVRRIKATLSLVQFT